jgi:putative transposase
LQGKEGEAGRKVADMCRAHGITEQTYYRWKAKYGGMDVSDAKRLKALEHENSELKKIVADLTLDNRMLRDVNSKNVWSAPCFATVHRHLRQDGAAIMYPAC